MNLPFRAFGRRTAACLPPVALIVLAADIAAAQAIRQLPLRSAEITFAVRASRVNDFVGTVEGVRAAFSGTSLQNVTGWAEFRVADMRTGIGLRDGHMRDAMEAEAHPLVRFELVGVDPGQARGDTVSVTFQGPITIRGVTRTIRAPGWVVVRPDATQVQADFRIDMRMYGIDPPSRFLGLVRVEPVTDIRVRLSFGR